MDEYTRIGDMLYELGILFSTDLTSTFYIAELYDDANIMLTYNDDKAFDERGNYLLSTRHYDEEKEELDDEPYIRITFDHFEDLVRHLKMWKEIHDTTN